MPETTFYTTFPTSQFLLSRAKNGSESGLRSSVSYRFGFNGKENDNEIKGDGNSVDFGARIYDSRLGRWMSMDPLQGKYPNLSPYCFVGNMPLCAIDPDGKDIYIIISLQSSVDGSAEIKKYNLENIINQLAGSEMGQGFIEKYINNPNEDVYITIAPTSETSLGVTIRAFDKKGNLDNPDTYDVADDSYVSPENYTIDKETKVKTPILTEFEYTLIDKTKKNYFITLKEVEFGVAKLAELAIKKGAKVLGHEMGAHLNDKEESHEDEEHDAWGQKEYGTFQAEEGSDAQKLNKEVDKAFSSDEYSLKDLGRGRYKLVKIL